MHQSVNIPSIQTSTNPNTGSCLFDEILGGLGLLNDKSALTLAGVLMKLSESDDIELGLLDDLNLTEHNVLKGEDHVALLLDGAGDVINGVDSSVGGSGSGVLTSGGGSVSNELLDDILEVVLRDLLENTLLHDSADALDLRLVLGIASNLLLAEMALSHGEDEDAKMVAIKGLSLNDGLNKRVAALDKRANLITSDVHSVEVGQKRATGKILAAQGNLTEVEKVILRSDGGGDGGKETKVGGEDTALKGVRSKTSSLRLRGDGEAEVTDGKVHGGTEGVPLLAAEGVHDLLLGTLLALISKALSDSHD